MKFYFKFYSYLITNVNISELITFLKVKNYKNTKDCLKVVSHFE